MARKRSDRVSETLRKSVFRLVIMAPAHPLLEDKNLGLCQSADQRPSGKRKSLYGQETPQ